MVGESDTSDLGPVIATKKQSTVGGILFAVFGVLILMSGILTSGSGRLSSIAVIMFGAAMTALGVAIATGRGDIREHGITTRSAFGTRSIAFSNVRTFSYWFVIQNFQKRVGIMLYPFTGKRVAVVVTIPLRAGDDPDLATVRDQLSGALARKLHDDLQREGAAVWLERGRHAGLSHPTLKITRDGFTIDDGRSMIHVPATDVALQVKDGRFSMTRVSDRKRLVFCRVGVTNFFPGLELLARLRPQSVEAMVRTYSARSSSRDPRVAGPA